MVEIFHVPDLDTLRPQVSPLSRLPDLPLSLSNTHQITAFAHLPTLLH